MSEEEKNIKSEGSALTPEPAHEAAPDSEDTESDVDGCDVPITEEEATADEDLPITEGGVA